MTPNHVRQRHADGFTLIELLIVIIVIGVLAGIAVLAFESFQVRAQGACEEANVRMTSNVGAAEAGAVVQGAPPGQGFANEGWGCD